LSDALARGYLPQELPPCFTSADFASKASSLTLPSDGKWRYPAKFSLTRAGGLRRSAEIPNPFSQYFLAEACSANWTQLQRLSAQSPISLSRPVRGTYSAGRSLAYKKPIADWGRELVARMPGGRLTLRTDISQFYPSIYTHAVDWAIRGKKKAKLNIHGTGLGPTLDKLLRNGRGGQTIGLSVGPDTSWLIAEVVLAKIDAELAKRHPTLSKRCARFGDDMTFYAASHDEAHSVLATYQHLLLVFELAVNPNKVAVIDGLEPVEARWVRKLRTHRYRDRSDSNLAADVVDLFDLAFDERQRFATQGVMSYAIMRCNPFPAGASSWPLYRDLVLASVGLEPSTLRHAYRVLRFAKDHGLPVDQDRVSEVLNDLLARHAALEHGFETAWILFILRELGLPLDAASGRAVAGMSDACSLILLRDLCEGSSRLMQSVDFNQAVKRAEADDALSSSDWLLAYEFRHARWARPKKWDSVDGWKDAHRLGVTFYVSPNKMPKPRLRRRLPLFRPSWAYPVR
jgi:hypothetical protein